MSDRLLDVEYALGQARTHEGVTLAELNQSVPVLVAFVSRFGSEASRESLEQVIRLRPRFEHTSARVVVVHGGSKPVAEQYLRMYGLTEAARVHDPGLWLYRAFRLQRDGAFGLHLGRARAAIANPSGLFLLYRGEIIHEYRGVASDDESDAPPAPARA